MTDKPMMDRDLNDLMNRLYVERSRLDDRKQRAVMDLMYCSTTDIMVKKYLDAWVAGGFENFEMALCAMAVQLSKERTMLLDKVMNAYKSTPPQFLHQEKPEICDFCKMKELYFELLHEVHEKVPEENRQQTALRYLRERRAADQSSLPKTEEPK